MKVVQKYRTFEMLISWKKLKSFASTDHLKTSRMSSMAQANSLENTLDFSGETVYISQEVLSRG